METQDGASFGALLRRYRVAAGLTQEELAERAGLSVRGIAALETGERRTPRRDTVELLADALALSAHERAVFSRTARPRPPSGTAAVQPTAGRSNLPMPLTSFIGREQELAAVRQHLRRPDVRLLTLTGVGGTGKTRLAIEVAGTLQAQFTAGVSFVSLAPISDPALVASAIAQALGVVEVPEQPLLESLMTHLHPKQLLLVLDNFEQVRAAAPLVTELLARCPALKVLVTSRALLRVAGERGYVVPPLVLPARTEHDRQAVTHAEAVRLFLARAQAVNPTLEVTDETIVTVAAICWRLDGLPLAIELAAARSNLLNPPALLARLDRRLPVLRGGAQDLPPRQQTLRATIDWSYQLLAPAVQTLVRRLSVFVGGWTLEAAEAVCTCEGTPEVLEGLAMLVDNSLLQPVGGADVEPRFSMLETIREYARELLARSGEAEPTQRAHAAYYLTLAEAAAQQLRTAEQVMWLERLEREHANLRAALAWAREHDAALGLRLAGALWRFWFIRGYFSEGRTWLEDLLAQRSAASRRRPGAPGSRLARLFPGRLWTGGGAGRSVPRARAGRRRYADAGRGALHFRARGRCAR